MFTFKFANVKNIVRNMVFAISIIMFMFGIGVCIAICAGAGNEVFRHLYDNDSYALLNAIFWYSAVMSACWFSMCRFCAKKNYLGFRENRSLIFASSMGMAMLYCIGGIWSDDSADIAVLKCVISFSMVFVLLIISTLICEKKLKFFIICFIMAFIFAFSLAYVLSHEWIQEWGIALPIIAFILFIGGDRGPFLEYKDWHYKKFGYKP